MAKLPIRVLLISVSIVTLVFAGCAKRPALSGASAPAPTGATTGGGTGSTGAVATAPTTPAPAVTPPARDLSAGPGTRPAPREFEATADLKTIHFDFDKSDIRPGDAAILDANARWLGANPKRLVLIEGHCDERGTNEYNTALGERRARATMDYLIKRGIQQGRISTVSYGEERPLCTKHEESCWSQNRRAQFLSKAGE
jgi:peptidoglycan-associated lipoprotein